MARAGQADLVRRLIADDPSALEEAYHEHAARCNAIAFRVLWDGDAARDAVQEAFLSLWRHRRGLVVRTAGIGPWLYVVVRNAAVGMLRSGRGRAMREERSQLLASQTALDPAEIAGAREDAQRVRGAIAELPGEQKVVVEMAYFQFMTMAQIAQATETPLSTVKRRAQRGLRELGRLLGERS